MRKLLIFLGLTASLALHGCSTVDYLVDAMPNMFDGGSLVYKPVILQGNIVAQEQVDKLRPGMSRHQVRFILGTPTLEDSFHANQWDYHFTRGEGSQPDEIKRFTVYFNQDKLARVSGDMQIQPETERKPVRRATVVKVPDWEGEGS